MKKEKKFTQKLILPLSIILLLLIIGTVIKSLPQDPHAHKEECVLYEGLVCLDTHYNEEGLTMLLQNQEPILMKNVTIEIPDCGVVFPIGDFNENKLLNFTTVCRDMEIKKNTWFNTSIRINYYLNSSDGLDSITTEGFVTVYH